MKKTDYTNWPEVIAMCQALGLTPGRKSHLDLAASLVLLTRLDEATLRKSIFTEPETTATPRIQPPTPAERTQRKLNFLKSRYERSMHLRDREPRDSFEWHIKHAAARLCIRQVDELEAQAKRKE